MKIATLVKKKSLRKEETNRVTQGKAIADNELVIDRQIRLYLGDN